MVVTLGNSFNPSSPTCTLIGDNTCLMFLESGFSEVLHMMWFAWHQHGCMTPLKTILAVIPSTIQSGFYWPNSKVFISACHAAHELELAYTSAVLSPNPFPQIPNTFAILCGCHHPSGPSVLKLHTSVHAIPSALSASLSIYAHPTGVPANRFFWAFSDSLWKIKGLLPLSHGHKTHGIHR